MTMLILGLHDTSIISSDDNTAYLDETQETTNLRILTRAFTVKDNVVRHEVRCIEIINPVELSKLIETAYQEYDGILIISSSGLLDVLKIFTQHLDLTASTKEKLKKAPYFNVSTDYAALAKNGIGDIGIEQAVKDIKECPRDVRLEAIIRRAINEKDSRLINQSFVVLDSSNENLKAYKKSPNIITVKATTSTNSKGFYEETVEALKRAKIMEDIVFNKVHQDTSFFKREPSSLKRPRVEDRMEPDRKKFVVCRREERREDLVVKDEDLSKSTGYVSSRR